MDARDVIQETREAVLRTQAAGVKAIDPERLLGLLDLMEEEVGRSSAAPAASADAANLKRYEAELTLWVAQNQHVQTWQLESFKQVIALGQEALKSIVLINGGAAVALLAFIGHLVSTSAPALRVAGFSDALGIFVFGVFLGSLAHGTTYIAQLFYESSGKWLRRAGMAVQILTIVIALSGLACFICGSNRAHAEFIKPPPN